MIISASRRTDIPAYYSDWLLNRLTAGTVLVPNPRSTKRLSRVLLSPEVVDAIVFWTKNPAPMLDKLALIEAMGYPFYFQFTLTPYGKDVEPNLPPKEELIKTFQKLSQQLGPQRVQWRYDPIFVDDTHSISWHEEQFARLCRALSGYTRRCTISFLDEYRSMKNAFCAPNLQEVHALAESFSAIAKAHNLPLFTCAEAYDLQAYGIQHGACIDKAAIEAITGTTITTRPDKNQRPACACAASVDIGVYDTCANGCRYCYATWSHSRIEQHVARHNPQAPALTGWPAEDAVITNKTQKSDEIWQQSLFTGE